MFNTIGYFQFNNLIQGRIPMLLVLLDNIDLNPWFNHVTRLHLENITVHSQPDDVLSLIQQRKLPLHYAVLVLDNDGAKSANVVASLEKAGFTNAYYIKGGFAELSTDRHQ
ncbi:rhodanese-like domain-containing protein [Bdellovibrio sp. ArHS]|uniref:rhodanese-like domain-containing protein n=1 Tax=Bdellovibrio sp. ArHS TaxID=1569284 RepID=UPI0025C6F64B|nr:rhodanese-like domain-containing protein [Bdellovibrio sp. ArHS]